MDKVRAAIEAKIKELEWKNNLRSLEVIDWLKELKKLLPEAKVWQPSPKEIFVEVPEPKKEAEVKPVAKKKIVFKKK
ncbi:MAG: hypothetical protein J6W16_03710 [Methanobrevibacter sp.]|nr:hypothetical protein [Clostridia bacterium]MBO7444191.1 hypothetical protein [Methanobrevibacter sp.]MBO7693689.1 hypothetical protein [Methanobrevibacter sp.]MBP5784674.1 hypothetical protein [Methanobrevibacter sp.]